MFVGALYMTSGTVRRKGLGLLIGGALACLCGPSVFAELRYEAKIIGIEDSQLADLLDDVSELKSLDDRLPASEEALRRRAERDLDRLRDAARSLGYWNAEFSYEIDSAVDPVRVVVVANPGPLYRITSIDVRGPGGQPLLVRIDPDGPPLPLKPGDPARTEPVVSRAIRHARNRSSRPKTRFWRHSGTPATLSPSGADGESKSTTIRGRWR
jgi:hypothetical protein